MAGCAADKQRRQAQRMRPTLVVPAMRWNSASWMLYDYFEEFAAAMGAEFRRASLRKGARHLPGVFQAFVGSTCWIVPITPY